MIPVFCGNSVSTTAGGESGWPRAASSDPLPVRSRLREDESVIESLHEYVLGEESPKCEIRNRFEI
jgi:hypothetical protein